MLVELNVVEQRYQAVLEVLHQGATVTDVARRNGVTSDGALVVAQVRPRVWPGWRMVRRSRCRVRIR